MPNVDNAKLFENNAPKLIAYYINKNFKIVYLFGSYEDAQQQLMLVAWNATLKYNTEKGKYSTFILTCIKNSVKQLIRKQFTQKRNYKTISLDKEVSKDVRLCDILPNDCDVSKEVEDKENFRFALQLLNAEAFDYYIKGMKLEEIACKYNYTKANASKKINKNIEKIRVILER